MDQVADTSTDLPHMLPSERALAAAADALNIKNDSTVVVYDGLGTFSAPRAWWTFRAFGHDRCVALGRLIVTCSSSKFQLPAHGKGVHVKPPGWL